LNSSILIKSENKKLKYNSEGIAFLDSVTNKNKFEGISYKKMVEKLNRQDEIIKNQNIMINELKHNTILQDDK